MESEFGKDVGDGMGFDAGMACFDLGDGRGCEDGMDSDAGMVGCTDRENAMLCCGACNCCCNCCCTSGCADARDRDLLEAGRAALLDSDSIFLNFGASFFFHFHILVFVFVFSGNPLLFFFHRFAFCPLLHLHLFVCHHCALWFFVHFQAGCHYID